MRLSIGVCLFWMILLPVKAMADQMINTILFEGNEVTDESILRLEMLVKEGDMVDIARIEKTLQYIRDLRLFEWVHYRLDEDASTDDVTLVIMVRERYYLIPLPTAKLNNNNDLEYGVKLRWDNIAGLNHQLRWKVLNKGSSNGIKQFSNKIDYDMPRIFLSRYQLTLHTQNSKIVDEDPDEGLQLQRNWSYGFGLSKWLNKTGISKGLFAGGGISTVTREITSLETSNAKKETLDAIVYGLQIGVDKRYEYDFNREGRFLRYKIDFSAGNQSADQNTQFVRHEIEYIKLNSYSQNPPVNFNYRLIAGQSNSDILGDKAFQLGGNTNLRGHKTGAFRGNAVLRGNFEYLSTFDESPFLRKVLFIDTGAVSDRLTDIQLSDFKYSVGAGIRWKIRQLVRVDVRVDAAYAFDTGDTRFSLGAHSTF